MRWSLVKYNRLMVSQEVGCTEEPRRGWQGCSGGAKIKGDSKVNRRQGRASQGSAEKAVGEVSYGCIV